MFFSPEGLFGALLARHREMGVGVGGGWGMGGGVRRGGREGISEEGMWRRVRRGWTEEDGRDR